MTCLDSATYNIWFLNKASGLKALDTFGNCQRPVFSLGVSHMYKITKHENLKFQENDERKNALIAKLQMHNKVEC